MVTAFTVCNSSWLAGITGSDRPGYCVVAVADLAAEHDRSAGAPNTPPIVYSSPTFAPVMLSARLALGIRLRRYRFDMRQRRAGAEAAAP